MTVTTSTTPVPPEVVEARERYARAQEAYRLGEITRDEIAGALDRCMNVLTSLSVSHRPNLECPAWCNDHQFFWGETDEEGHSNHGHRISGNGWEVTIDEEREGFHASPYVDGSHLPLPEARAYANALLLACDAVEGSK